MTHKAELRLEAQRVRSALNLSGDEGDNAATRFMEKFTPVAGTIVALYWPVKRELDTLPLIEQLHQAGVRIALPVVAGNSRVLAFREWTPDTTMTTGLFGIPIPPETAPMLMPDMVVMPLLAFDRKGYRLGHGSGYYDATAAAMRAHRDVTLVGYAYAEQMCLFALPREEHDMPMDYVVTPQGIHSFA